jgi:radical SAM protein with 4Fe4S-binding SPASM domain
MRRPDICEIVEYGAGLGLRMAITPSGTSEVTFEALKDLKERGLARLAVSLDGSTANIHDAFRQVAGSYEWTLRIMRWANELDLSLQINTTITRHNLEDFDPIAQLLETFHVSLWSVFFLVPMGRANLSQEPRAQDFEMIFNRMAELSRFSSYQIKSTEAPQYRRVLLQNLKQPKTVPDDSLNEGSFTWSNACRSENVPRPIRPVNDGKGFVFISHIGEIYPSGFLPLSAGNVKTDSLVDVYRNSKIFKTLRDASKLKGKCGACEYKSVCGGSRARAYAVHGDTMASDPFCVHVPKGYQVSEEEMKFW